MKDIELCGLGNGLVDLQFVVSDNELLDADLLKGTMVLIDTEYRNLLMNKFSNKDYHKVSGGSAANTIISFAQLGGKGAYKTVLGNDDFGHFYAQEFKELGIVLDTEHINSAPTGTCIVFITPDSERTLYTCLAATADFGEKNINEDIIKRSEWLYIEGYKFSEQESTKAIFKALELAKKHGTKVAVTFSDTFVTELFKENLEKVVIESDLVFCNESEASSFTGEKNPELAFEKLCKLSKNVAVTYGGNGSKIFWQQQTFDIPAYSVKPIDTTGAGDSFAGAFLYGIIKFNDALKAGHLASYISSKIVAQMGPRAKFNILEARDRVLNEIN
jgi:sugar/nucleoside kinase (ribokinase family)